MSEFITTHSGRRFYFNDPKPDQVFLPDIAYALAHTYRWGGHADPAISVGQHSIMVCDILIRNGYKAPICLQGLVHDAAEAYLGDIPTPIKAHLPDFMTMEILVEDAIFTALGVPPNFHPAVKLADVEARKWEYRDLMDATDETIGEPYGNRATITRWAEDFVVNEFVDKFYTLKNAMRRAA